MLSFLEKKKFVLVIGDDGAVLAYVNQSKLEKRLFTTSPSLSDRREFHALLTKYPNVPVYVLLDTMEQSYTKQTLPAVSSLAVGKLVKKRLDRDFAASDIKGAVLLGRDKEGRRDWIYMFAASPVTPAIAEWVDYIASLENKFTGIYMLPVEMEGFVRKLNKAIAKDDKTVPQWQFIITHNKTGGFRQTVLQDGKVIFTRLVHSGKDILPDIIAGNIEQEILNTIDYMRRLSMSDEDDIKIIIVVSKEIKRSLENTKIRGKNLVLFSPFEVAELLGFKDAAGKEDKFSDLIIATNFASSSTVLKLENPKMKKVNSLLMAYTLSTTAMVAIFPIFAIYSGYMVFSIIGVNRDVKNVENEKANIERKWKDARKTDEYNIDDANKITDVVTLHKELTQSVSPFEVIRKISVSQKEHAMTRSLNWNYEKALSAKIDDEPRYVEKAIFNLEFSNRGDNLEEMFQNFDEFSSDVISKLQGYQVEVSELPEKVSFEDKKKLLPVQIKVVSVPKDES